MINVEMANAATSQSICVMFITGGKYTCTRVCVLETFDNINIDRQKVTKSLLAGM